MLQSGTGGGGGGGREGDKVKTVKFPALKQEVTEPLSNED